MSLQNHEEIIPVDENLACTREPVQGKNQNFRTQSLAKANKKTWILPYQGMKKLKFSNTEVGRGQKKKVSNAEPGYGNNDSNFRTQSLAEANENLDFRTQSLAMATKIGFSGTEADQGQNIIKFSKREPGPG